MGKDTIHKINKPRAIRRLVIWYKRNSAVTSIVDTAASSAVTASNVAGNVVSGAGSVVSTASNVASNVAGNVAGNVVSSAESVVNTASSVVSNASSIAKNTLQPLVFDPLKRLQNNDNILDKAEDSQTNRIWIAVDSVGFGEVPAAARSSAAAVRQKERKKKNRNLIGFGSQLMVWVEIMLLGQF